ncbi:MAG: hypothetical protein M0R03_11455 [Novosphingobium sp.]|nr:hypothetical protein [Novosphingobium sp.]
MRYEEETDEGLLEFKHLVEELYFSERKAKEKFLMDLKIYPQIWIDDNPHWIFTDSI